MRARGLPLRKSNLMYSCILHLALALKTTD